MIIGNDLLWCLNMGHLSREKQNGGQLGGQKLTVTGPGTDSTDSDSRSTRYKAHQLGKSPTFKQSKEWRINTVFWCQIVAPRKVRKLLTLNYNDNMTYSSPFLLRTWSRTPSNSKRAPPQQTN